MSERGSFVTEYIHCPKCLEEMKKVLIDDDKYLCSQQIKSWEQSVKLTEWPIDPKLKEPQFLPIIAGKIGGCGICPSDSSGRSDDDFTTFAARLQKLHGKLCHEQNIFAMGENWRSLFSIDATPAKEPTPTCTWHEHKPATGTYVPTCEVGESNAKSPMRLYEEAIFCPWCGLRVQCLEWTPGRH